VSRLQAEAEVDDPEQTMRKISDDRELRRLAELAALTTFSRRRWLDAPYRK
jgi:hypothetical protein